VKTFYDISGFSDNDVKTSKSKAKAQIKLPTKEFRSFILTHKNIIKDINGSSSISSLVHVDYNEVNKLSYDGKNYKFLFPLSVYFIRIDVYNFVLHLYDVHYNFRSSRTHRKFKHYLAVYYNLI
jgi:hypothetical protein